jgi:hypothetical protein
MNIGACPVSAEARAAEAAVGPAALAIADGDAEVTDHAEICR